MKKEELDTLELLIEERAFLQEAEILLDRVLTLVRLAREPELEKTSQDFWWAVYRTKLRRNDELVARKEALRD